MNQQKMYHDGIEKTKKSYAILENIQVIILLVIGFIGMYPLKTFGFSLISIFYALFAFFMLVFILRKHLCTRCYYYDKWCHCGWGKLSSAIFKKDSGNQDLGGKLAGLTWVIIFALPIIGMSTVIFLNEKPVIEELYFFISFIILIAINVILHKNNCDKCKMRFICPGSAAKKE